MIDFHDFLALPGFGVNDSGDGIVPNGPAYPSYAFRFDSEEGSVVFSGDTAYSENVIRLAHGADMLGELASVPPSTAWC